MTRFLSNILPALLGFLWVCALNTASANQAIRCEQAVNIANHLVKQQNDSGLNNEAALVNLLRTLNNDNVLPIEYVTTTRAKELGWKGEGSLWDVWLLNKKVIGGDPYRGKTIAQPGKWYSADLESVRGFRSNKRLVYSPDSRTRYLTVNAYQNLVEIVPCQ